MNETLILVDNYYFIIIHTNFLKIMLRSNKFYNSFCLVGFRLLPSLNKILISIQNLRYSLPAVDILSDELDNFKKIKIDQFKSKNQIYIEDIK